MEMMELFNLLESNQLQIVEDIKKKFHEHFNSTKESWLLNGLFEHYLSTGSIRTVEILVGVREPHDKYLFDKLSESVRGNSTKLQALTLLGHIVRRHPTWLYKITNHSIFRDLLKLLRVETDILPLMSALLVIIVLLPMIAGLVEPHLQEIFQVFSHLAAWNTNNPNKVPEGHLIHLQMGLYALFHRLYGMFPCNFLSYLRHEYRESHKLVIFSHTIKPMLDTVKMHPLLVTASKDAETSSIRWKKMEPHDVIVECAKFAVDATEKPRDENYASNFLSNSCLDFTTSLDNTCKIGEGHSYATQLSGEKEVWSPSIYCGISTPPESAPTSIPHTPIAQTYVVSTSFPQQEGTSPPEAAVEATPETTPIKDMRHVRGPPSSSNIVRALNTFGSTGTGLNSVGAGGGKWVTTSGNSTPAQSQPSSPMRKEPSPFLFPSSTENSAFQQPALDQGRDSFLSQKMQRIMLDRVQVSTDNQILLDNKPGGAFKPRPNSIQPTSPLKLISGSGWGGDSPLSNSPLPLDAHGEAGTQEDKEVEIMMRGQENALHLSSSWGPRQCDSVIQEIPSRNEQDQEDDYEECQLESGSPCPSGGLHMPNSKSMMDFARQIKSRHRYYSQCQTENITGLSSGSSPSESFGFPLDTKVRRTNSCPEMKKTSSVSTLIVEKPLVEKEEDDSEQPTINGHTMEIVSMMPYKQTSTVFTQTDNMLPYEHLFLGVFPALDQQHFLSSNNSEENQFTSQHNDLNSSPPLFPLKTPSYSPYQAVQTFINITVQANNDFKKSKNQADNELKTCREQLQLLSLQLQFEKHRREMHSERNRRLLGKSRNIRALEEHNSALRDQVGLLQSDKETILNELEKNKREANSHAQNLQDIINRSQQQNSDVQKDCKLLKNRCESLEQELKREREKTVAVTKEWNLTKAALFDTSNELQQAVNMASAGRELREELQTIQKELTLAGEVQQKYRENIRELSMVSQRYAEESITHDTYTNQIAAINQTLETRTCNWDSAKARIVELEILLSKKDTIIADLKRKLKTTKDEYHEQLEAVESKYTSLRSINCKLEEQMLELFHRTETSHSHPAIQSSPLSTSLSSSGTLFGAETAPIKNLQLLVDTADHPSDTEVPSSSNNPD